MNEKEERKRIRRERVHRRLDKKSGKAVRLSPIGETEHTKTIEKGKSELQVQESLGFLVKKKQDAIRTVTQFRVNDLNHENKRRLLEQKSQVERSKLAQSLKDNVHADIMRTETSWEELTQINNAMDLFQGMEQAKQGHVHVSNKMDEFIEVLRQQLIGKEEDYLLNLTHQSDVTTQLQVAMDNVKMELQNNYLNELKSIQETFVDERANKVQTHLKALNDLVDKKTLLLANSLKGLVMRRDEKLNIIKQNQDETASTINDLKASLHAHVNSLEIDLAISKSMYHTNSDQLEYNLRATAARISENEDKIMKRKKKIIQFKEELNKDLKVSKEIDLKERRKNVSLNQDCSRLEGQYNNLLSKLYRFEMVEGQKYTAALAMHQDEINQLSNQILDTQREVSSHFSQRYVRT